jgi:hypothetical protein
VIWWLAAITLFVVLVFAVAWLATRDTRLSARERDAQERERARAERDERRRRLSLPPVDEDER